MTTRRKLATGATAVAIALVGVVVGVVATPGPTCVSDAAAAIAATPSGGTFVGTGCTFTVPNGVRITQPVTVQGGTFSDPSTTGTPGVGYGGIQAVFRIQDTHNVTLDGVTIVGGNPAGTYKSSKVGQTGIRALSVAHLTITNATIRNTFGDGITLFADLPKNKVPCTDVVVANVTLSATGRQGISPSDVFGATFTNVEIGKTGTGTAWDFESDLPGVGAGNVTVADSKWQGITNVIEFFTAPIAFTGSTGSGLIIIGSRKSSQPVTFSHDTFAVLGTKKGRYVAGIMQAGGVVAFVDTTFTRKGTKTPTAPLWSVKAGGVLTFTNCTLAPPLGVVDATSTATVTP